MEISAENGAEEKSEHAFAFQVTEVREEQPEKALLPMLVTELGIVMLVSPSQPENASFPIMYFSPL